MSGTGASGGAAPKPCLGLQPESKTETVYTPPNGAQWYFVGQNDDEFFISVAFDRAVRIVAVDKSSGTTSDILTETEYTPSWSFQPTDVLVFHAKDEVDVLVSDGSYVALVRKQGTSAQVIPVDRTDNRDLHALSISPGKSGPIALYWKGDDAKASDQTLTAVDVTTMQKTTQTSPGPASYAALPHTSGLWLTAERLDAATECTDTGKVVTCSGGVPAVALLDCTFHVDIWNIKDAAAIQGRPFATVDVKTNLSANCDDPTPAGLATFLGTANSYLGVAQHHAMAVDPYDASLALVSESQDASDKGQIQFDLLDLSGSRLIDNVRAPISMISDMPWLATRTGRVFYCGSRCAMADSKAGSMFLLDPLVSPDGAIPEPDGVGLIGIDGGPVLLQRLNCTH